MLVDTMQPAANPFAQYTYGAFPAAAAAAYVPPAQPQPQPQAVYPGNAFFEAPVRGVKRPAPFDDPVDDPPAKRRLAELLDDFVDAMRIGDDDDDFNDDYGAFPPAMGKRRRGDDIDIEQLREKTRRLLAVPPAGRDPQALMVRGPSIGVAEAMIQQMARASGRSVEEVSQFLMSIFRNPMAADESKPHDRERWKLVPYVDPVDVIRQAFERIKERESRDAHEEHIVHAFSRPHPHLFVPSNDSSVTIYEVDDEGNAVMEEL